MKICIVQTKSEKKKVQANIENHLKMIRKAIKFNIDLIVFPELSITNYEPKLAEEFATDITDHIFNPFQDLSDTHQITIGVGMPTKSKGGINISMLIFQPNKEGISYSKCALHPDELPYFVPGNMEVYLNIKGKKIALGICYETLQRKHFVKAIENKADIYIASVSKSDKGTDKAYLHFSSIAREFKTPILMSNSVGQSENFLSNGLSSVWNRKGELIGKLDKVNQGVIIYDTESELTEVINREF